MKSTCWHECRNVYSWSLPPQRFPLSMCSHKDIRISENAGFHCTDSYTACISIINWTLWLEPKWIKLLHDGKIPPKGVSFSDFICTFAMSFSVFVCLFLNATLRQVRFLTWLNSEQLFVNQVHIKNELMNFAAEIRQKIIKKNT